jgi:hypothetical protein
VKGEALSEQKTDVKYPWQEQSFATRNIAMVHVHENLMQRLTLDGRVHAETLLRVAGAIIGFAAQNAAWKRLGIRREDVPEVRRGQPLTRTDFFRIVAPSGEDTFHGDLINSYITPQNGYPGLTVWHLVATAANELGVPIEELRAVDRHYANVARSVAAGRLGALDVPPEHQPHLDIRDALKIGWPLARQWILYPPPGRIS